MAKGPKSKSATPKAPKAAKAGQKMWGGRFSAEPGALMQAINVSIDFDRKLASQDIAGSKAHSDMLAARGIISVQDRDDIHAGLDEIGEEISSGTFPWSRELEDIHLNIEARHKPRTIPIQLCPVLRICKARSP